MLDSVVSTTEPIGSESPRRGLRPWKTTRDGGVVVLHYRKPLPKTQGLGWQHWTRTVSRAGFDLHQSNVLNDRDYLDAPDGGDLPSPPDPPLKNARRGSTLLDTVQKIRPSYGWKEKRDRSDQYIRDSIYNELRKRGIERESERLDICGIPRSQLVCTGCGEKRDPERIQCNIYLICPTCQRVRKNTQKKELERAVKLIKTAERHRFKLLTMTIDTQGDYNGATRLIIDNFSKLWRSVLQKRWEFVPLPSHMEDFKTRIPLGGRRWMLDKLEGRKTLTPKRRKGRKGHFIGRGTWVCLAEEKGQWGYWKPVGESEDCAAFRSIEFGELTGNAHVHALLYSEYIPQVVISQKWQELTGSYVADIRATSRNEGIDEVCKYVCKTQHQSPAKLVDFYLAVRGRHTTQRYGQFRALVRTEKQLFEDPCECGCLVFDVNILPYDIGVMEKISMRGPPVQAELI